MNREINRKICAVSRRWLAQQARSAALFFCLLLEGMHGGRGGGLLINKSKAGKQRTEEAVKFAPKEQTRCLIPLEGNREGADVRGSHSGRLTNGEKSLAGDKIESTSL